MQSVLMPMERERVIDKSDVILVTGANGFIGTKVVETLIGYGFEKVWCLVRSTNNLGQLKNIGTGVEIIEGNLLSLEDCRRATAGVKLIFNLAVSIDKSFSSSFLNSVLATRNLLDAVVHNGSLRRWVQISSFAVYSNWKLPRGGLLDETCEVEPDPVQRYEPYCYAKIKQDQLVIEYGRKSKVPYVIVRPGAVYGPRGRQSLTPRIGIDTFGIFLHLGGRNRLPLSYVDNCAEAIVLAGLVKGVERQVFNIVDDDLPRSREFLRVYKRNVKYFRSVYILYPIFYFLCYLWEKYSAWSEGQLPPVFNRRRCAAYWKGNRYSNEKAKRLLGWTPRVPFRKAVQRHCEYFRRLEGSRG